jgi:hypothetical protein
MMQRRWLAAGLGVLLSTPVVGADEVYVGTVAVSTVERTAATPLVLTIRAYTSDDRVLQLANRLHLEGHAATIADMAKGEAGTLRLGDESFRASVVRLEKTATGRMIRIITDKPMQAGAAPAGEAVGYLELQLPAQGEGSGRLLPLVKPTFDAEGFVAPENLGPTWTVASVKPGK